MSLLIGEHIQECLTTDAKVSAKVGERVYPIVVVGGAPEYPFITYTVEDTHPGTETKDGVLEDVATVSICSVAKTYGEAVRIAHYARYALEGNAAKYADFEVLDASMVGSQQTYESALPAFGVMITVEFNTIDF